MLLSIFISCLGSKIDSATDLDSNDSSTEDTGYPSDPSPFTISISGAATETLVFDDPTCASPTGSTNMRMFWRNKSDAHVFVLLAEILGDFNGAGTYTNPEFRANIKLQEEAGGQARYFASTDASQVEITYEIADENFIYGSATALKLYNGEEELNVSPNSFPIWCDNIER